MTGSLGGLVVVLETGQHQYRCPAIGLLYRSRAEALTPERYLCRAQAGPYVGADRAQVLAERLAGLLWQEYATWTRGRPQADLLPARAGGGW